MQEDNYYQFGLRRVASAGNDKYLYNGKELQEELEQYDYASELNLQPLDMVDLAAFNHDRSYFQNEATGLSGALLEMKAREADIKLAKDALDVIKQYKKMRIAYITSQIWTIMKCR